MLSFLILSSISGLTLATTGGYYRSVRGFLVGDSNPDCSRRLSRTGCVVSCSVNTTCGSVSFRSSDKCCVLNQEQLYDFDARYNEDTRWEHIGHIENKVAHDDWTLVFKAVAGSSIDLWNAWTKAGVSHDTDLANRHPGYFSKFVTSVTQPFYRSQVLDQWTSSAITEVKLGLFENGVEVFYMTFDGTGSTNLDWFTKARLQTHPYIDLLTQTPAVFSAEGKLYRKFYVTMTGLVVDCNNFGWLVVLNIQGNICDFDKEAPPPQFLYARGPQGTTFKDLVYGKADILAVFVKTS